MGAASRTPIQGFLLKQRGIVQVIVIGLLANTRIETTSRFEAELSYHATWSKTQPRPPMKS